MSGELPRRAALDTSFLVNLHKRDVDSVKALQRLERAKTMLILPEVVWAEMETGPGGAARIPDNLELLPVAFDRLAAKKLTEHFPTKKVKLHPGDRDVWKFDALILASALAAKADAIVTNNPKDYRTLVTGAGLPFKVFTATELLDPQLDIFEDSGDDEAPSAISASVDE